jgi:hypothetical protein
MKEIVFFQYHVTSPLSDVRSRAFGFPKTTAVSWHEENFASFYGQEEFSTPLLISEKQKFAVNWKRHRPSRK